VPFRLAFVTRYDGLVQGEHPYIDDSFTSAEALDAAHAMLVDDGNDNDAGLQTCLLALDAYAEWALDDEIPWRQSKLEIVSINPDAEQSPKDGGFYVGEFAERIGSSSFAVHGIAGDVPSGCGDGSPGSTGVYADPSETLYSASILSGGVFLSICEKDWTATAATLASAFLQSTGFHLAERPMVESLQMFVDGKEVLTGWSYAELTNTVTFDKAVFPSDGAHVRAEYLLADSCE
jgi:hypothetical protein